ncbi:hypothetical protein [Enterococcus dispar]|uniref:hypothetical protein n=1 Tax=Enterococcus dispar TaxID=44009 RepID=UPI00288E2675|nr:hypothetical protein [Enterococcus dispar]MDT2704797.1 hypothetical protein [Enterococcus dispar]
MEYRNKKTGFSFFSKCKISGEEWEVVENNKTVQQDMNPAEQTEKNEDTEISTEVPEDTPTGNTDIDDINRKDIMQELDAMGIQYNSRAKKQELYDLMMSQGA